MSLPEIELMAGQMILAGLRRNSLDDESREMLESGFISGFLLFPESPLSIEQLRRLTDSIRSAGGAHQPLIAIDQEGGRVNRLKEPFTQFPSMRRLAAKKDERLAFEFGQAIGRELFSAGINIDFAPVVDLDLNPENQVIGDRSLGSDPEIVSRLAQAIIAGLHSEKVLACAKHFPGHGASREDSHLELPRVEIDRDLLQARELLPFRDAIAAGVDTVMAGHLLYPRIDRYHPATLSEKFLEEILREELGFEGAVIVDSLEMSALETIPMADRAFMAARAGADLLLCTRDLSQVKEVHLALCQAIKLGALSLDKVYLAHQRIRKLKGKIFAQAESSPRKPVPEVAFLAHRKLAELF